MFACAAPGNSVNLKQNSHFGHCLLSEAVTETVRAKENLLRATGVFYHLLFPHPLALALPVCHGFPIFMEDELTGGDESKGEQATSRSLESTETLKRERIGLIKYFRIRDECICIHSRRGKGVQLCVSAQEINYLNLLG